MEHASIQVMSYRNTLITVAGDCPATSATPPPLREEKPSAARLQYEMFHEHPYELTHDEVLFESKLRARRVPDEELSSNREELWQEFFGKDQACMRASDLGKRYGWGIHFDTDGRGALVAMESEEYQRLLNDEAVVKRPAMRSSRKG